MIAQSLLTPLAIGAFGSQVRLSGIGPFLFPSDKSVRSPENLKTAWRKILKRAGARRFGIYDPCSAYGTRLSTAGVADEQVTQLLRKGTQRSSRSRRR